MAEGRGGGRSCSCGRTGSGSAGSCNGRTGSSGSGSYSRETWGDSRSADRRGRNCSSCGNGKQ